MIQMNFKKFIIHHQIKLKNYFKNLNKDNNRDIKNVKKLEIMNI